MAVVIPDPSSHKLPTHKWLHDTVSLVQKWVCLDVRPLLKSRRFRSLPPVYENVCEWLHFKLQSKVVKQTRKVL